MPLVVTEETNAELATTFYPDVKTILVENLEHHLKDLVQEYDQLVECKYWKPHLKTMFRDLYGRDIELIFCPHGMSEKGRQTPVLAPYAYQDQVLFYGQLHRQLLKELKVEAKGTWIGNYRRSYYESHRSFYDALADRIAIDRTHPTLLYAPTWNDADQATSFFTHASELASTLLSDWNLIVKLHPLLEQRDPAFFYAIIAKLETRPNTHCITHFPAVYPLLALADAYLGDYSSVGYDYLAFEKPMFFLTQPHLPPTRLHECGTILSSTHALSAALDQPNSHQIEQRRLYKDAFFDM
jgi:hypothetical protein